MKKVPVFAKLLAPVAIKRDRQSERSESSRFVAGTLLRGALASIYLQQHEQADSKFELLFLNEAVCRFGPLDPSPQIFPLTAAACKREGLRHTLVDLLWFRVAQHHLAGRVPEGAEVAWRKCAKCGADLKAQDGFRLEDDQGMSQMATVEHQVAVHVGIDRHTGTAADSIFFTLEALGPSGNNTDLHGWIRASEDALDPLRQLLHAEGGRISVGHARTRGYGDMRLRLGEPVEEEDQQLRVDRWNQWNSNLLNSLDSQSVPDIPRDAFYFALLFPTGAVLVDRFLRYTLDPADMIAWLPPMSPVSAAFPVQDRPPRHLESGGAVRWITAVTRHELVRGWNAAHGLPRQDDWAIARGAVYVYRFEGILEQREAFIARLAALSDDGVGLRRNEGFGVVEVSNEFHRQFRSQEAERCMC